jgi:hypothetical protein
VRQRSHDAGETNAPGRLFNFASPPGAPRHSDTKHGREPDARDIAAYLYTLK